MSGVGTASRPPAWHTYEMNKPKETLLAILFIRRLLQACSDNHDFGYCPTVSSKTKYHKGKSARVPQAHRMLAATDPITSAALAEPCLDCHETSPGAASLSRHAEYASLASVSAELS